MCFDGYMKSVAFILLADDPILDFVNTLVKHSDQELDFLSDPRRIEDFFKVAFETKVAIDKKSFVQLKSFRKTLKLFFYDLIQKPKMRQSNSKSLPWFKNSRPLYLVEFTEMISQDKFSFSIQPDSNQRPLVTISRRLIDFLLVAKPSRIKKCKSKTCSHLFYDKTKANSRLWCSMKSCGNLAKIRKFRKLI